MGVSVLGRKRTLLQSTIKLAVGNFRLAKTFQVIEGVVHCRNMHGLQEAAFL